MTSVAATRARGKSAPERNRLRPEDRAVHDWYRFVLSFPSHLVRDYLDTFGVDSSQRVLDPFCGTGTTLVECKKLGIPSVGIERNPMAGFASRTKVDWSIDPHALVSHAREVADRALTQLQRDGIDDLGVAPLFRRTAPRSTELRTLPPDRLSLLLKNSISPLPLHKTLVLLDTLEQHCNDSVWGHERLALAMALVSDIGNLHFGPEVGVGKVQEDAPVIGPWLERVRKMSDDLTALQARAGTEAIVHLADSRQAEELLEPSSIDAVITSPPYPNEKDYTRTTRLESVLLGLVRSKQELRDLKQGLVRSNTRSVYKADTDDALVAEHEGIQRIARRIEERRIELGKDVWFRTSVRAGHEAVLRRHGPAPVRPPEPAASRRETRVRRRRPGLVPESHDPDRPDPRRARPAPRLRADGHRPVPDADRHRQQTAATGRGRAPPLARKGRLGSAGVTHVFGRLAFEHGASVWALGRDILVEPRSTPSPGPGAQGGSAGSSGLRVLGVRRTFTRL